MTRADIFLLLVTLLLLPWLYLQFWHSDGPATRVRVLQPNAAALTLSLQDSGNYVIEGNLGNSEIEIENGRARFLASPCNNKICLHRGWIENSGEVAACLPNGVALIAVGGKRQFDAINY
jgi:hypothetical protein